MTSQFNHLIARERIADLLRRAERERLAGNCAAPRSKGTLPTHIARMRTRLARTRIAVPRRT